MGVRISLAKAAFREFVSYDLGAASPPAGFAFLGASRLLQLASKRTQAFDLLIRAHHPSFSRSTDRKIENEIARATSLERNGQRTGLWDLYDRSIGQAVAAFRAKSDADARRFIGTRILVVKHSTPGERGVLMVDYTYVFPLLAGLFDLAAIARKYFIVLEPSWSDCCTPEILGFTRLESPVLIQSVEPRDKALFGAIGGNCSLVPTAPNWWVDFRTMSPGVAQERDIDIIMVAAWTEFKRHWRFFRTLSKLRRRGHRLKVALVGYRGDKTAEDIRAEAAYFGVLDQIEMFERISSDEVARLFSRSKIHLLWSRREGANRAIIESMLADVPVIVRDGLTYGFKYPYINRQTGQFAKEDGLADAILDMIANRREYSPREWVLENMTCHQATAILNEHLSQRARGVGEPWTEGVVSRTSALDKQHYWNPDDRARFEDDYRFLESKILPA